MTLCIVGMIRAVNKYIVSLLLLLKTCHYLVHNKHILCGLCWHKCSKFNKALKQQSKRE